MSEVDVTFVTRLSSVSFPYAFHFFISGVLYYRVVIWPYAVDD